jgi:hypothetical protein
MGRRADLDWPRIRAEYETGAYTLRALAERHGVKHTTIHQRIKREGWTQDPSSEVKRLRNAKLAQLDASEQDVDSVRRPVAEAAAERQVDVIASHRRLTKRLRGTVERVLDLVHLYLHGNEEQRIEAMVILKLGSGDSLTGHLNSLSTTIERIVRIERDSYGLSEADAGMNLNRAEALRSEIHERMARLSDGG